MNRYLLGVLIILALVGGFATVDTISYLKTNCPDIVKQGEKDPYKMSPLGSVCVFIYPNTPP